MVGSIACGAVGIRTSRLRMPAGADTDMLDDVVPLSGPGAREVPSVCPNAAGLLFRRAILCGRSMP